MPAASPLKESTVARAAPAKNFQAIHAVLDRFRIALAPLIRSVCSWRNFETPLLCQPPQIKRLSLRILIAEETRGIQNRPLHLSTFLGSRPWISRIRDRATLPLRPCRQAVPGINTEAIVVVCPVGIRPIGRNDLTAQIQQTLHAACNSLMTPPGDCHSYRSESCRHASCLSDYR